MELLSSIMAAKASAPPPPAELRAKIDAIAKQEINAARAEAAFDDLKPALASYRCDEDFVVKCALIVEKQRKTSGMMEFWSDVHRLYPTNPIAVRMIMRWYRRARQIDEGLQRLYQLFPDRQTSLEQAGMTLLGLSELRAFHDMDALMSLLDTGTGDTRSLKMRYIKSLCEQARFSKAKEVADTIPGRAKMGTSSQALLDMVDRRAEMADRRMISDQLDVISELVKLTAKDPRPLPQGSTLGSVVFFTGQLGTGGAERQMTRIASEMMRHQQTGQTIAGIQVAGPIHVCVKHANPVTNSDFFLPVLRRAKIPTTILSDLPDVAITDLEDIPAEVADLLDLLPEDVLVNTLKLVPYFRETNCQIAYLWQDGGVLAAAIAALIARVPRIVTSFRGMPPNLRRELYRPHLTPLYQALSKLDHVVFSSNSRTAGSLYEDWLGLADHQVKVIRNATYVPDQIGTPGDDTWWADVVKRSPTADKTVLGVFRFDHNKRPQFWVDVAADLIKTRPDTRFVIVGGGFEFVETQARIAKLGLANRIFLAGVRSHVGFFYDKADMVMHLARMEGLPNVLIEAQLAGLPVLATPAGGTAEVVEHGLTGQILSDAYDPPMAEVVDALKTMLDDEKSLARMGEAAERLSVPKFLTASVLSDTVKLFLRIKDN